VTRIQFYVFKNINCCIIYCGLNKLEE